MKYYLEFYNPNTKVSTVIDDTGDYIEEEVRIARVENRPTATFKVKPSSIPSQLCMRGIESINQVINYLMEMNMDNEL